MPTPLWKKLGYKEGFRVRLVHPPVKYMEWVAPLPEGVGFNEEGKYNLVHIFTNDFDEFMDELLYARTRIQSDGMIWISWFKRASKLPSELTEDLIRETAIANRLVDVKVCSINDQWSALKLVIPVRFRGGSG